MSFARMAPIVHEIQVCFDLTDLGQQVVYPPVLLGGYTQAVKLSPGQLVAYSK